MWGVHSFQTWVSVKENEEIGWVAISNSILVCGCAFTSYPSLLGSMAMHQKRTLEDVLESEAVAFSADSAKRARVFAIWDEFSRLKAWHADKLVSFNYTDGVVGFSFKGLKTHKLLKIKDNLLRLAGIHAEKTKLVRASTQVRVGEMSARSVWCTHLCNHRTGFCTNFVWFG